MGDDYFSVEHTGVRVRKMAGTLERLVKYDAVAFQKAWDFLASSDDEDNYFIYYLIFFVELFSPGREQNMAFFEATVFFAAVGSCRVMSFEKKKFQLKKRQRFRKNHRRGHRTRARARINITPQTYGTEEVEGLDAVRLFFVFKNALLHRGGPRPVQRRCPTYHLESIRQ